MPKWNIDKAILKLEKATYDGIPLGTIIQRVLLDHALLEKEGLRRKSDHKDGGSTIVWCLALGPFGMAKRFFYGYTIYQAYQKARKFVGEHIRASTSYPDLQARKAMKLKKAPKRKPTR